jgi:hypothetical protein
VSILRSRGSESKGLRALGSGSYMNEVNQLLESARVEV